ncbi:MAG: UbiD family decarboxylase [Deltaproteobacteria bacterium]|nr:UbiD family decarboxylase [Deltaproteobacteria bacterium]
MGYTDLHEHLKRLEEQGLLYRIKEPVNKDTEMHPLVRWQFRGGIPEAERKAFLFENVTDSRNRKYSIPVTVGALAASPRIYAVGMGCPLEEINARWEKAIAHPIDPVIVSSGPVQEEVHMGKDLKSLGLDEIPVPISTPGFDNGPYTTCSHWFTKDPETGIRNVGNYRGQIKSPLNVGLYTGGIAQDAYLHWDKCRQKGIPMQAALVVGAPPMVSFAAVQKFPYGVDELSIAGGLAGEPIRLVKCKTVDIEVPAEAEIVIEGNISTEYLEPEGPFGESHGYMHPRELSMVMDVTAITHRKDAVFVSFISQVTPSESSVLKKIGYEPLFYRHLRHELSIKSVVRVSMHEPLTNLRKLLIIQMHNPSESEIWRALHGAAVFHVGVGKIIVAVDEDIDPEDPHAVFWAMCYRMKPHQDLAIVRGMEKGHAPPFSGASTGAVPIAHTHAAEDSALLINAILKEPFPPISLPKKEFMEKGRDLWEKLGLPPLKPERPWYGYSLGQWDDELDKEAKLAVEGRYYETGEKLKAGRKKMR